MGSIPAWAGETRLTLLPIIHYTVYPRVGGGNRAQRRRTLAQLGLSPRGRGKRISSAPNRNLTRSIPAWAGETAAPQCWRNSVAVYPRVGGGNRRAFADSPLRGGLSPRGRGKRMRCGAHRREGGSIPAWAGETMISIIGLLLLEVYPRVGGGNPNRRGSEGRRGGLSPRGRGKPS